MFEIGILIDWIAGRFLPPLIGAAAGVYIGFRINTKHQLNIRYRQKLIFLDLLRHQVKRSIELLDEEKGNFVPVDVWNSLLNSGSLTLFDDSDQSKSLSDIYFEIQNYNYEAKRTRDAGEHFRLLPVPMKHRPGVSSEEFLGAPYEEEYAKEWEQAHKNWQALSNRLIELTKSLSNKLKMLEKMEWFIET